MTSLCGVESNVAESDADRVVRQDRRSARFRLRSSIAAVTQLRRVRGCGRTPVESGGVALYDNAGVAHYSGVSTCASVWACPVCSAKIRQRRAEEITAIGQMHLAQGGSLLFVTLTVPHHDGDRLSKLLDGVASCWSNATAYSRLWRSWRKANVVGVIRSMEVTHGVNGWHPHLHVMLLVRGGVTAAGTADVLAAEWAAIVGRAGLGRVNGHGVDVRSATDSAGLAEYVSKVQDVRGAALEVARGDMKRPGRSSSSTPFDLIARARESGELGRDVALWREYEKATKGRQAITFSAGLRDRFGMAWVSDIDIAGETVGGEVVGFISSPAWKALHRAEGTADLLSAYEAGGFDAACDLLLVLTGYGLSPP